MSAGRTPPPAAGNHGAGAVVFKDYDGSERTWTFLRWKNRAQNLASDEVFVRDGEGRANVLTAGLPWLPDGHWTDPPFPECNPSRIEPFRLIPPPCRATEAEAKALVEFASSDESRGCVDFNHKQARFIGFVRERFGVTGPVAALELWELLYGSCWWPGRDDNAPLQAQLETQLDRWREERDARSREVERITEADVQRHLYGENSEQRVTKEQVSKFVQEQRRGIELKFTEPRNQDGVGGCLHTTFEDVLLENAAGLRNSYLHRQWAKMHGFDLATMARERIEFLKWLKRHYVNRRVNVINQPGNSHYDLSLLPAQELAVLATVRYVMHFITGERVYLAEINTRDKLRDEEMREAGEIAPENPTSSGKPNGGAKDNQWHSENYDQVWWMEDLEQKSYSLTPTQARAICVLDTAHRRKLSTSGWMDAIYTEWKEHLPAKMTPRKIFTSRGNLPVWEKLIRKDGQHYELVLPVAS